MSPQLFAKPDLWQTAGPGASTACATAAETLASGTSSGLPPTSSLTALASTGNEGGGLSAGPQGHDAWRRGGWTEVLGAFAAVPMEHLPS